MSHEPRYLGECVELGLLAELIEAQRAHIAAIERYLERRRELLASTDEWTDIPPARKIH